MCTVSWLETPGGYELFFNRDERRSRQRALLPSVRAHRRRCFVAPTDADSGGTWLAVNDRGLSVGLLNHYDTETRPDAEGFYTSRGLLVLDLVAEPDRRAAAGRLAELDLSVYRPFTLLLLDPSEPVRRALRWDSQALQTLELELPFLTSSSHDPTGVERARREQWQRATRWTPALLRDLHRAHQPERGPYSPCMHRPDASTVSFSWISVDSRQVSYTYSDGPPCQAMLESPVALRRD